MPTPIYEVVNAFIAWRRTATNIDPSVTKLSLRASNARSHVGSAQDTKMTLTWSFEMRLRLPSEELVGPSIAERSVCR
jgi:hypothetical protein